MEWNTKAPAPHSQWDWENSAVFPGKLCEISSPKRVQLADWAIEADVGTDNGSFHPGYLYLSGGGGCAGSGSGSGSDLGSGSSSKSSVSASASADSLLKAGIKNHPEFNFNAIESHGINGVKGRRDMGVLGLCCLVNSSLDMRDEGSIAEINSNVEQNGKVHHGGFSKDVILMKERNCGGAGDASLAQVASIGSGEALIGLKLGKRTYFEVPCVGSAVKASSFPEIPVPSPVSVKKIRASYLSMQNPRCQVEGCNLDLSSSKDYHQRHKVCESHSKSPKVTVAGQEQRFCQQCSRFHDLLEFDGKKRSCRRRLSDHNARRRKQQPEAISFNSTRLSSSLYDLDGRQQMNLVVDRVPLHTRALASPTWEGACDIKFTQQKGSWLRTGKAGNIDGQFHMPCAMDLSNAISVLRHDFGQPLPFKSTAAEVFEQGMEASLLSSNLTAAPDPQRALSLLSNSSWCSTVNEPISLDQLMHVTHQSITQPVVQALHQGLPLAGSVIWQAEQSVPVARAHSTLFHNSGNQFQEYQLFRVPYESAIFDSDQLQ